jgi:hypothetical protein
MYQVYRATPVNDGYGEPCGGLVLTRYGRSYRSLLRATDAADRCRGIVRDPQGRQVYDASPYVASIPSDGGRTPKSNWMRTYA